VAITGVHAILVSHDAAADRAFLANVLGLASVDAGEGWLISVLPPAELAAHPAAAGGGYELYLMCDDLEATVRELKAKGVEFSRRDTALGTHHCHRATRRRPTRALRTAAREPAAPRALSSRRELSNVAVRGVDGTGESKPPECHDSRVSVISTRPVRSRSRRGA
jgi:hypothetical protein